MPPNHAIPSLRQRAADAFARSAIRIAARLVPPESRGAWREEWEAEVWHALHSPPVRGGRGVVASRPGVARLVFGAWPHALWMRRNHRTQGGRTPMADLVTDVRFAFRAMRRAPGFACVAVLTIGVAIGANTAVFSVVNGLLLRRPPYPEPDRVVHVGWSWENGSRMTGALSAYKFEWLREHARVFDGLATWRTFVADLGERGEGGSVAGLSVSDDFFRVIGMSPQAGRAFLPEEQAPGGPDVVIVSDAFWRERFDADPGVIGRDVRLYGRTVQVVGVMPPDFEFLPAGGPTSLVAPLRLRADPQDQGLNSSVVGRLAAGVTKAQAEDDMDRVFAAMRAAHPELIWRERDTARLSDYQGIYLADLPRTLWVLLGAVGLVLLISCANVANLLLARGTARSGEMAVRATLGAGRSRIARQVLAESLMLAVCGGAMGFVIGSGGLRILLRIAPATIPGLDHVVMDARVLLFTLGASLLSGFGFGLIAAVPAMRADLVRSLRDGRRAGSGTRAVMARNVLVGAESALAVMLLAGAGLLITSFTELRRMDLGFDAEGLQTLRFHRVPAGFNDRAAIWSFEQRFLEELRTVPGVTAAAAATELPLGGRWNIPMTVEGRPDASEGGVEIRPVSREYFDVMGMRIVRGRAFNEDDVASGRPVIMINESLARMYWPDGDAIGSRLLLGMFRGEPIMPGFEDAPREVIGVVEDIRESGPTQSVRRTMFVVHSAALALQNSLPGFLVRARASVTAEQLQAIATRTDARLPVPRVQRAEALLGSVLAQDRFNTLLMSLFAAAALALTAIGIYGVVAWTVRQRSAEIGVRMALGARRSTVLTATIRSAMAPVIAGLLSGILLAIGLTRFLSGMLHDVSATDPVTFAGVIVVLCGVALAACYIPARRAAGVDPVVALRSE